MSRFYTSDQDKIIDTHSFNDEAVEIRCSPDGVFYAEFHSPREILKDRNLLKVRKLIEAEILKRGSTLFVPFVRVHCQTGDVEFDNYGVSEINDRGTAFYVDHFKHRKSLTSLYDNERFLKILTPQERADLESLATAAYAAEQALEKWMDEREFNLQEALAGQKAGTYSMKHAPEPEGVDDTLGLLEEE